jgi:hypothetical protein
MAPEGVSWANLANENNAKGTRRRGAAAGANWRRGPVRVRPEEGDVMTWQRGGPLEGRRVIYTRKAVTSPGGTTRYGTWVPVFDEMGDYGGPYANAANLIRGDAGARYARNLAEFNNLRRAEARERDPSYPTRQQNQLVSEARDVLERLAARGRLRPAVMRGVASPPPSRSRSRSRSRAREHPNVLAAAGVGTRRRNRSRSRSRGRSRSRSRGRGAAAGGQNRGRNHGRGGHSTRGRGGRGGRGGR